MRLYFLPVLVLSFVSPLSAQEKNAKIEKRVDLRVELEQRLSNVKEKDLENVRGVAKLVKSIGKNKTAFIDLKIDEIRSPDEVFTIKFEPLTFQSKFISESRVFAKQRMIQVKQNQIANLPKLTAGGKLRIIGSLSFSKEEKNSHEKCFRQSKDSISSVLLVIGSKTKLLARLSDCRLVGLEKVTLEEPVFRKWSNSDGKVIASGKFVSENDGVLTLVDVEGNQTKIKLSSLSSKDQWYYKLLQTILRKRKREQDQTDDDDDG